MLVTVLGPSQALLDAPAWVQTEDSDQTRLMRSLSHLPNVDMSGLELTWLQTAGKVALSQMSQPVCSFLIETSATECRGELGMQAAGGSPWPVLITMPHGPRTL